MMAYLDRLGILFERVCFDFRRRLIRLLTHRNPRPFGLLLFFEKGLCVPVVDVREGMETRAMRRVRGVVVVEKTDFGVMSSSNLAFNQPNGNGKDSSDPATNEQTKQENKGRGSNTAPITSVLKIAPLRVPVSSFSFSPKGRTSLPETCYIFSPFFFSSNGRHAGAYVLHAHTARVALTL
jgi:hypothetical protein